MSFNRPHYLKEVLATLKAQTQAISPDRIFLFQDGYRSVSGKDLTEPSLVEACIAEFTSAFPGATVFSSEANLGVALNFNRAEEFFFLERNEEAGLFFEDDLILSPYYLSAVENLLQIALSEPKIAYVAAYGDHRASLEAQRKTPRKIITMGHKWGFGLTKRQWLIQRPIIQPYLEIVARADYRSRDTDAIYAYHKTLGFGSRGSSQDAMKDVACAVLGTVKINSFACFGKYIGATGLHSTPSFYEKEGFGKTEIYPDPIENFEPLSSTLLDAMINDARQASKL
jgi:hypothetical protein